MRHPQWTNRVKNSPGGASLYHHHIFSSAGADPQSNQWPESINFEPGQQHGRLHIECTQCAHKTKYMYFVCPTLIIYGKCCPRTWVTRRFNGGGSSGDDGHKVY